MYPLISVSTLYETSRQVERRCRRCPLSFLVSKLGCHVSPVCMDVQLVSSVLTTGALTSPSSSLAPRDFDDDVLAELQEQR